MVMKRLRCLEAGRFQVVVSLLLPVFGLLILGCSSGSGEATPPRDLPAIATDRYERVQVAIDGKPVDAATTITVGKDFIVTVSFRRLHAWPGMNNPESMIEAMVMLKVREHTVTCRYPSLAWQSEKDGVLTFTGKVTGLDESGVFGFRIRENVTSETLGLERHILFATNIRSVKP